MKEVVSVSLGSSRRDHEAELEVFGERVRIRRIGTDGSIETAIARIRELDGRVDAFGMGGIDLYIVAGGRRYSFRDARRIAAAARRTPIVDGSGLKDTLEREVVRYLGEEQGWRLAGRRVLMMSAVDRFGMAEAFAAAGASVLYGDLIFALQLPVPLRSMRTLAAVARVALPVITLLPFQWVYPTGSKQEQGRPKFGRFFDWAEIIAGDFHFIRRYMPERLQGKIVLTNTVTAADVEALKARGVAQLITTTPNLQGRSFGTNVLEALLVAISGGGRPLQPAEYRALLGQLDFRPRIETFDAAAGPPYGPLVSGSRSLYEAARN